MAQVKEGDKVKIHMTGVTGDGIEFTSTAEEEPIEINLGQGEIWPSVEHALLGMKEGESKEITLKPEESIPYVEELVFDVNKSQLPQDIPQEEGVVIRMLQPDGREAYMKILSIKDEIVTLDANHPFAGEELHFTINLVKII